MTIVGQDERKILMEAGITHVGVGTDDTAAAPIDMALGVEVDRQAKEATIFGAPGIITVRTRFLNALVAVLKEVGSFDAGVAGNMSDRIVHAAVNKVAGVEMLVDIEYTVS